MLILIPNEIVLVNGTGCACVTGNSKAVDLAIDNDFMRQNELIASRGTTVRDGGKNLSVIIDCIDSSRQLKLECVEYCCNAIGSNHWFWGASWGWYGKCQS